MKAGIKFLTLLLALSALFSCKPEYTIAESTVPTLHEGQVLWLDLTRFTHTNTSDPVALRQHWDALHLTTTLQGLVNRTAPRLYIDFVVNAGHDIDQYWWDKYSEPGEWLAGRDKVVIFDPVKACDVFKDMIKGLVVYDPNVAATSCLASMVAGVEDLVAVRYDTTPGSVYNRMVTRGYPVKVWLVNEDGSSKFASKGEAYRWAIDNYLKTGKCETAYAAYYIDQAWMKNPSATNINHHQLTNHDFFISHRSFFFDLSPWADEPATDNPDAPAGEDFDLMKEMLMEIYKHNNNGDVFCHIGGFPAWPFKYTSFRNVGGIHTPETTEWKFAEIISAYNAFKDADAVAYGALANASFWQHFPLQETYPQKWVTRQELKDKGYLTADGKVDRSKRYVLLYVGDYDAASWVSQTSPTIWDDPQRGKVPMMWSISPILARRSPQALHYMWKSATPNDYFASGDNGAGYLNPGALEEPRDYSHLPSGIAQWAAHCKPWYKQWDITVTGFVIDGNAKGMSREGFKAYASFSPNGVVPQRTLNNAYISQVDGMPILRAGGSAGAEQPTEAASVIRETVLGHTNMPFYWFRAVLKTPTWYVTTYENLKKNDPNIVWTSGPEFFELLRCYLEEQ